VVELRNCQLGSQARLPAFKGAPAPGKTAWKEEVNPPEPSAVHESDAASSVSVPSHEKTPVAPPSSPVDTTQTPSSSVSLSVTKSGVPSKAQLYVLPQYEQVPPAVPVVPPDDELVPVEVGSPIGFAGSGPVLPDSGPFAPGSGPRFVPAGSFSVVGIDVGPAPPLHAQAAAANVTPETKRTPRIAYA
jgi:hypothetical protein